MHKRSRVAKHAVPKVSDQKVAAAFARQSSKVRQRLFELRELIFATAAATPGVGPIHETLKWNEPAYVTLESKAGSTIRIDGHGAASSKYSMYFNCNTNLVGTFRTLFPKSFRYVGEREIEFDSAAKINKADLKLCIGMALTYHLDKRKAKS